MSLSPRAQEVVAQVTADGVKLGDIKKLAKSIKRDHALALELWSTGAHHPRRLAVLLFDKKQLDASLLDRLCEELMGHPHPERSHVMDWLMANQLMKSKPLTRLITTWQHSDNALQRRTFWYHQGRLRWTGNTAHDNTEALLDALETDLEGEVAEVQWAMNFVAGQVGIHCPQHRARCVALGERTGLFRDEKRVKGCTPNYLPEYIQIEVDKRAKAAR